MNAAMYSVKPIALSLQFTYGRNEFVTCAFFMSGRRDRINPIAPEHFAANSNISKKSRSGTCAELSNGLTVLSHTASVLRLGRNCFLGSFVFGFEGENYRTWQQ